MLNFFRKLQRATPNLSQSKLVKQADDRSLYFTQFGEYFWLNEKKYLDKCIIDEGVFEKNSTDIVKKIIKPGFVCLDIGANIGYYSVIMSRLVGDTGQVFCFEPTKHFGEVLKKNLEVNKTDNCQVLDYGLSQSDSELVISIGECSATLHWVLDKESSNKETIIVRKLDSVISSLNISRLDFIKIDVDGHEPAFLEGAWNTIEKYNPVIFLEVSHEHFLDYGVTAWDFYDLLKDKGYYIYSEDGFAELKTKREFLFKCGNFTHSANIFISRNTITL